MCAIFVQLAFPQQTGTKTLIFQTTFLYRNSGFRAKNTLIVNKCIFVTHYFAISEPVFKLLKKDDTLKKTVFIVFHDTQFYQFFLRKDDE